MMTLILAGIGVFTLATALILFIGFAINEASSDCYISWFCTSIAFAAYIAINVVARLK